MHFFQSEIILAFIVAFVAAGPGDRSASVFKCVLNVTNNIIHQSNNQHVQNHWNTLHKYIEKEISQLKECTTM